MTILSTMTSLALATVIAVTPNVTTEPTEPPDTDTPTATESPSPTETPTIPAEEYFISINTWVDDNFDGKQNSSEVDKPRIEANATFTDGTTKTYRTENGVIPQTSTENRELKSISFSAPTGYTINTKPKITNPSAYEKDNHYSFDVQILPVVEGNISSTHKADGEEYTVTYTIENSGYKPLVVNDSLGACSKSETLAPHTTVTCEKKAKYYVESKALVVPNTITLSYKDRVVEKKTINTRITEKSPAKNNNKPPVEKEPQKADPKEPTSAPMTVLPEEKDTEPAQNEAGKNVVLAIIAFLVLVTAVTGIIVLVRKNKKEQEKKEQEKTEAAKKAQENNSSPNLNGTSNPNTNGVNPQYNAGQSGVSRIQVKNAQNSFPYDGISPLRKNGENDR